MLVLLPASGFAQSGDGGTSGEADELLQQMERNLFPDGYYMKMEMRTTGSGRDRELLIESWYRKGAGTYMELLAPARSRGTRILETEGALWMYVPRSGNRNAVRLPARDDFQGSAFSNADVGSSSYTDDYYARLAGTEVVEHPDLGAVECHVLELLPSHEEAPYGKIVAWVSVEGSIALQMDYFVRSGLRSKQMFLSDIRSVAGRRRPMRMEMERLDESGKRSVVDILELEERDAIPDRTFSRPYLTR
jgi:outer membrane lipoprotein-sorting protein